MKTVWIFVDICDFDICDSYECHESFVSGIKSFSCDEDFNEYLNDIITFDELLNKLGVFIYFEFEVADEADTVSFSYINIKNNSIDVYLESIKDFVKRLPENDDKLNDYQILDALTIKKVKEIASYDKKYNHKYDSIIHYCYDYTCPIYCHGEKLNYIYITNLKITKGSSIL
jgi:3D (Asp-Asp-Asp) domain-containing protein